MFETLDSHRSEIPEAIASPGVRYWDVVSTAVQLPFLIAHISVTIEDECWDKTIFVSSDIQLVRLLDQHSINEIRSLLCIAPPSYGLGDVIRINAISELSDKSDFQKRTFALERENGVMLCGPFFDVPDAYPFRRLLRSVAGTISASER